MRGRLDKWPDATDDFKLSSGLGSGGRSVPEKIRRERTLEIPQKTVRRLTNAALTEAQLNRLSDEVANLRRRLVDPTAANAYLTNLEKQRASLLTTHMPTSVAVDFAQQRFDQALVGISDLLFPWSVLNLPYMTEGIYQAPGTPDTSGDLGTAGLYAGGIAYAGELTQDGTGGPAERWWVHTWRNSAVFPAAPSTGRLYYRFAVDAECNIYRDPVDAGSVRSYVTIGTTGDVASDPVDQWTNWQTVGWPINSTLPLTTVTLDLQGGATVTGSIPVSGGKSAALGFIYGTVISVAGGLLQILYGIMSTRRSVPGSSAPVTYRDYDKIEYRFEPDWWVKAVQTRLTMEIPARK
jgi:hypothetical protein